MLPPADEAAAAAFVCTTLGRPRWLHRWLTKLRCSMVQPFDTVKGVQRRMSHARTHVVEVWLGVVEAVATECRVRIVKAEKMLSTLRLQPFRACKSNRLKWLATAREKHSPSPRRLHEHENFQAMPACVECSREISFSGNTFATAFHTCNRKHISRSNHTFRCAFDSLKRRFLTAISISTLAAPAWRHQATFSSCRLRYN